jgi:sec-independent protein translocase protein TatB
MFDIGMDEMLVIAIVAIVVIGPKDLPLALRTVGQWVAKVRKVSGHFRTGIETMIREAELEEMEKKWKEQNEAIMKGTALPAAGAVMSETQFEAAQYEQYDQPATASAEAALPPPEAKADETSPTLPFPPP